MVSSKSSRLFTPLFTYAHPYAHQYSLMRHSTEDDAKTELTGEPMTGAELRALVEARWGRAYDTRILQRRNKVNQTKLLPPK